MMNGIDKIRSKGIVVQGVCRFYLDNEMTQKIIEVLRKTEKNASDTIILEVVCGLKSGLSLALFRITSDGVIQPLNYFPLDEMGQGGW
jgi:hypothetical protein